MIYESLTLSALREEWEQEGDERKREKEAASSNNGFGFGFGFEFGLLEFGHLLSCLIVKGFFLGVGAGPSRPMSHLAWLALELGSIWPGARRAQFGPLQ